MTEMLLPFLGVTLITGSFLLIGFAVNLPRASFIGRFIQFMPVSVLTALVASALYRQPDHLTTKLLTLVVALGIMRYTRQLGVTVLTGLVAFWVFSWLLG